ncbi:carbon-nitrogen hydrolase family protein [Cupriavidus necator]
MPRGCADWCIPPTSCEANMSRLLKIALVQQVVKRQPLANNIEVACDWIDQAVDAGAQLVLFPEIHLSQFFPQYPGRFDAAIPLSLTSPEMARLRQHCRTRSVACLPNIYLQDGDACYDATIAIDARGEIVQVGKMVHIAQQPLFYEQDYYTPSDSGFRVATVAGVKVGIVVCFDRHFPESFRACARQGAELIVIASANTMAEPLDLFEAELRTAAFQNNLFIAMANRVGDEDAMCFAGDSIVVGPDGEVIKKADYREQLLIVTLDLERVGVARQCRPYIELLRPDQY